MDQSLINWIIASAGALIGFILKAIWDAVKDLQTSDKELADKVGKIEVLVAGEYVKKEEFTATMLRLFEKLDHIESKIDRKADK